MILNAPTYFQKVMQHELDLHGLSEFASVYIDDIVVFRQLG